MMHDLYPPTGNKADLVGALFVVMIIMSSSLKTATLLQSFLEKAIYDHLSCFVPLLVEESIALEVLMTSKKM